MAPGNTSEWPRPNVQSAIDDPMSPYFLHHSDNPGLILVSQSLTGDNYSSWSRAMKIALSVKNKIGFVDGTILKPSEADSNLSNFLTRNNNIVISWILNSVSKEISASVLFSESAADIWEDLKERFQQSNGPRIFQLRRDLINLRQEQQSVSVYFTKLKALWQESNNFCPVCNYGRCNCEGVKKMDAHSHMDYVMTFLMGLNDSFAQIRSQVLLLDPIPPINRVFSLVVQEERQRSIGSQYTSHSSAGDMAFALKSDQQQRQIHARGPARFHRERPFCTKCNVNGHTVDTCDKIHGYPPGYKSRGNAPTRPNVVTANQISGPHDPSDKANINGGSYQNLFQNFNTEQLNQLRMMFDQHLASNDKGNAHTNDSSNVHTSGICLSTYISTDLSSPSSWIVDSGASRHICSDAYLFKSLQPAIGSMVTLPNHTTIDVKFCGDIKLGDSLTLEDVMFIPDFKFNLLSVSSLLASTKSMISSMIIHSSFKK
ncbi:uncharacterized protein LOC142550675 [Primulina tabacum]|uniref:uncharacterized protein LOC142550675 n=1 Tax=Primulina tabacum TaxID=48773 RepID=UPI003F5A6FEF